MKQKQQGGAQIGICGIVFLIFLTLKLAGVGVVATWSWWAVTSPLWGLFLLIFVVVAWWCIFIVTSPEKANASLGRLIDKLETRAKG